MISRSWGKSSGDILEPNTQLISSYHRQCIHSFEQGTKSCRTWFLRPKTATEKQWHSLTYNIDGSVIQNKAWQKAWRVIFLVGVITLVAFYSVAIIATNSPFSPTFMRGFYWIAIIWSLLSSSLLCFILGCLGASKRDIFGAFLSALALWLVVIQVSLGVRKVNTKW